MTTFELTPSVTETDEQIVPNSAEFTPRSGKALVQRYAYESADGTVKIQGRLASVMPWVDVATLSDGEIVEVDLPPRYRFTASGMTAGTNIVSIDY